MAKKKPAGKKFGEDHVSNNLLQKFGGVIKRGTEVFEQIKEKKMLSLSPALDIATGGGIREGSMVIMAGPPKASKTVTALHFAAKCQKLGKTVIYLNTEGRMNSQNFEGIQGLNIDELIIIESSDERLLSGEDFLTIAEAYGKQMPGCVIIIDSLSSLVPKEELDGELSATMRNKLPRLLSMFFKRSGHYVSKNNIILLCIAHQIADTSRSHKTKTTDCGNMAQYQVGINLEITHKSLWTTGSGEDKGDTIGQVAYWKVLTTNNTKGKAGNTAEGWLRFGIGIDETQEIIEMATQFGLISGSAWKSIDALVTSEHPNVLKYLKDNDIDPANEEARGKAFRVHGKEKLATFLRDNPKLVEVIHQELKEFEL